MIFVAFTANARSENGEHDIFVAPIVSLPTTYQGDCPMTLDSDHVLGTHDEEIARLGIQHQVWRPHMLDAWARAGMTRGSRVVDFGAGPGYATCDAAEIVGPRGQVTAIERSPHFLEFAGREMRRRNLSWNQLCRV